MRWPSRRHRGSQTEAPTPVYRMHVVEDSDPIKVAQGFWRAFAGEDLPVRFTAKQVITCSLMRDQQLAEDPDRLEALAKGILLDLDEAGLEIVVKEEPDEVLRTSRPDRPNGW